MRSAMKSMLATTSLLLACAGTAGAEWGALTQDPGLQGCFSEGGVWSCAIGRALSGPTSMAMSKDGKHVYVADPAASRIAIYARSAATGALTHLGAFEDGQQGAPLASVWVSSTYALLRCSSGTME